MDLRPAVPLNPRYLRLQNPNRLYHDSQNIDPDHGLQEAYGRIGSRPRRRVRNPSH